MENEQPHQGIIAAAEEKGAISLSCPRTDGARLSKLLVGSVTNKVLAHAKTPVLVCQ